MNTLDVSVVAANYNNAPFLAEYFEAWTSSTAQPIELIFVDDGSRDESLSIARRYQTQLPNLIIIELSTNQGFGNALKAGIACATGKYILRIDPDDVTLPGRLERQYTLLENNNIDIVGSNAVIFQSNTGKQIGITNFPIKHEDIATAILRGEHGVLHPTVMARTALFRKHNYIQANVPAEDYDVFARMLRSGARFANISEPLLRYRIHPKSASNVLPFSTIAKTYELRDNLFNTHTSRLSIVLYYLHIKFYRKYLFSSSAIIRIFSLTFASLLRPDKALKRIARVFRRSRPT